MQVNADEALVNGLESLDKRQGWRGVIQKLDLSIKNKRNTNSFGDINLTIKHKMLV